jgi:hypothetical protein
MKDNKEQPGRQEKTIVIDITLSRGLLALLALVVIVAAVLGYLAWGQRKVSAAPAAPAAFSGMRKYYLTPSIFYGDEALTACAPGYHMASLWEILDPSNLAYNTELGFTQDDSGASLATHFGGGWVRTGWNSEKSAIAGRANCEVWTTTDSGYGTYVYIEHTWAGDYKDMHVWKVEAAACNFRNSVWCVED